MPDLLLEILSEEIPARMQPKARADLKSMILKGLDAAGVTYEEARVFSTPRRLTLHVAGLPERTPDLREERKGPRVGVPEKALEGFLRSTGLTLEQLEIRADKKGETYFAVIEKPGQPVAQAIAALVPETIRAFPWPKSMRWGASMLRWVRPISSILCLLDDAVVPLNIEGYKSGNQTRGHRRSGGTFAVSGFEEYVTTLRARNVILNHEEREAIIHEKARALCEGAGVALIEDAALLREVAGLTEWPVPLIGEIESEYRALPPELLQTSMREHQKYFSGRDAGGKVTHFIAVGNVQGADGGATILRGNAKVLRARLADAKFFWDNDLRLIREEGLIGMAAPLANVTFHNKLGSQAERIARIAALAAEIAPKVGARSEDARQAAEICKADLASQMVYEFPELQGVMGRYYALAQGLSPDVSAACEAHYKPLGPSDDAPDEPVSIAVALADKIDVLTGFWAIDEKPTGSKDPFALRRAALGVIRLVLENGVRISLNEVIYKTAHQLAAQYHDNGQAYLISWEGKDELAEMALFIPLNEYFEGHKPSQHDPRDAREYSIGWIVDGDSIIAIDRPSGAWLTEDEVEALPYSELQSAEKICTDLLAFIADRLKVTLREKGVRHDLIDSVFALGGQDDLVLLVKRVEALQAFLGTEDGANLLAGYKRAANILASEQKKEAVIAGLDPAIQTSGAMDRPVKPGDDGATVEDTAPETVALTQALMVARPEIDAALEREDFAAAMQALAGLRGPIDAFFEGVQVVAEDPGVRALRLKLLTDIRGAMQRVADFSKVEG